jgi:hypothetical protein
VIDLPGGEILFVNPQGNSTPGYKVKSALAAGGRIGFTGGCEESSS